MAEIVLFHHALGLTPGVAAFAEQFRALGHRVHVPDLYDGRTFDTIDDGVSHARSFGFEKVLDRGVAAVQSLPDRLVYAGLSLGAMPAQRLAQTRPEARGLLLCYAALPLSEFGDSWPSGVPVQIHMMEADPWAEEDIPAAQELVEHVPDSELFLYPGSAHLFADSATADFDPDAAKLLLERSAAFLARLD